MLEKRFSRGRYSGEHISNAFSGRRRLEHGGRRIDDFILLGRRPNYLNIIFRTGVLIIRSGASNSFAALLRGGGRREGLEHEHRSQN